MPRSVGLDENVLDVRRSNICSWLVVKIPDLPDLESRASRHVGAVSLEQTDAAHALIEVMAADADMIAAHPGLRHDEDPAHGSKCSTGTP